MKTIKGITNRIVKHYNPESVILFGSYGKGRCGVESDIDLLIIKETDKRAIDRRMEVEKLLSDRDVPLDIIVYTPREVRSLYSVGNPFIEEVMDTGRVLYMRAATEAWLKDARDEFESAEILFDNKKYRTACYHSQQCAEKALKAFILEAGKKPERTHDIVGLYQEVKKLGFDSGLTMDEAVFLNSIYKGRYPTEQGLLPRGEPEAEDAEKAIAAARSLMMKISELDKKEDSAEING